MSKLKRFRKCLGILLHKSHYVRRETYYSDCERKTDKEILWDQLRLCWRFGQTDPFYFTYGFDRKEMTFNRMIHEYILPYKKFQKRVNHLNFNNPRYDSFHGRLTGRVITGDKFYFNVFLERFHFPTPKVYCFIKDKSPLYFDDRFGIDVSLTPFEQLKSFLSNEMDAFAKPSDGQLGNGIFSLRRKEGKLYVNEVETSVEDVIEKLLSADYLIQERIYQHPALSVFCDSSINSIRLQTVMDKDGKVIPFGAGVRMGRRGSQVDNWAKGGVFVGVDMETGKLMARGIMKPGFGTSAFEHPDSKVKFEGYVIPYYKEAEQLAVRLHKYLYRCHSVGWDFAITLDGPVFIEGNGLWEISLVQAVHGGLKRYEKFFE